MPIDHERVGRIDPQATMSKAVTSLIGAGILGAGGYIYATPWISINQFREAIQAKDLPGIERHVDFPSLRTSLKDQLKIKLSEEITRQSGGNALVNFGIGAFGYALAEPMINAAVDAYISPAGLKTLMAGSLPEGMGADSGPEVPQLPNTSSDASVSMAYGTPNLFVVAASDSSKGQTVRFNFERRELLSWKLTSLTLP